MPSHCRTHCLLHITYLLYDSFAPKTADDSDEEVEVGDARSANHSNTAPLSAYHHYDVQHTSGVATAGTAVQSDYSVSTASIDHTMYLAACL